MRGIKQLKRRDWEKNGCKPRSPCGRGRTQGKQCMPRLTATGDNRPWRLWAEAWLTYGASAILYPTHCARWPLSAAQSTVTLTLSGSSWPDTTHGVVSRGPAVFPHRFASANWCMPCLLFTLFLLHQMEPDNLFQIPTIPNTKLHRYLTLVSQTVASIKQLHIKNSWDL